MCNTPFSQILKLGQKLKKKGETEIKKVEKLFHFDLKHNFFIRLKNEIILNDFTVHVMMHDGKANNSICPL